MGSVNKVILVGNLGREAELRYTPNGAAVAKFSIATTEKWNDKAGQPQERTEWHQVDLWGKQAETLAEYLTKGKQVYVEGRLQSDEWTDKDGVKRKLMKVRCDRLVLLGGGSSDRRQPATHLRDEDVAADMHSAPIARWLHYQRWDELSHQEQIDRWYGQMPLGNEPEIRPLHLPNLLPMKAQRAE